MIKKLIKNTFLLLLLTMVGMLGVIFLATYQVEKASEGHIYSELNEVPKMQTGLLLGTSKGTVNGGKNPYFYYRIEAAARLFKSQKIEYIIVSGDNSIKEYNETRDMKNALVEMGIPKNRIIEDYAGFRTLDSVVRAKKVFGRDSITIISQSFHNKRALYIAKDFGIFANAYNAKAFESYSSTYREYLARVKAFLDLKILNTQPKFYKDKEIFPTDSINS